MLKKLASAAFVVATLVLAAWLFGRYAGGWERFFAHAGRVSLTQWAGIWLAGLAFYSCDTLRFYCLLRVFGIRLSWWAGVRITCVSYLLADLTPTNDLYFPVVIFLLAREGVPVATAAAVSLAKSLYMTFWVCAISYGLLRLNPEVRLPDHVASHLSLYLSPVFVMAAVLATLVLFPKRVHELAGRVLARRGLHPWARTIVATLDRAAEAVARIGRSSHPAHLATHLVSVLTVVTYATAGYLTCRAVGLDVSAGRAVTAFSNGLMVGYIFPVPGAIGVAEAVIAYLLNPSMNDLVMAAALLQRLVCWYAIWIPGAALLALLVRDYGSLVFRRGRSL